MLWRGLFGCDAQASYPLVPPSPACRDPSNPGATQIYMTRRARVPSFSHMSLYCPTMDGVSVCVGSLSGAVLAKLCRR